MSSSRRIAVAKPAARRRSVQNIPVVVIAASRGGVEALMEIVPGLPPDFGAPICVVQHIGNRRSTLPAILERVGRLPAVHAVDRMPIVKGRIYVAPPDRHMVLQGRHIHLNRHPLENHTRPAADPLFRSAARYYGTRAIGLVLTGGDSDGTRGLIAIKEAGGISIVQRPDDAEAPEMPRTAAKQDSPDFCPRLPEIAPLLVEVVQAVCRSPAQVRSRVAPERVPLSASRSK